MAAGSEPFPPLPATAAILHQNGGATSTSGRASPRVTMRRRKSSALGGDIHAGDTGAPALASSRASLNASDPKANGNGQVRIYIMVMLVLVPLPKFITCTTTTPSPR